jgi:hypothetical protein
VDVITALGTVAPVSVSVILPLKSGREGAGVGGGWGIAGPGEGIDEGITSEGEVVLEPPQHAQAVASTISHRGMTIRP